MSAAEGRKHERGAGLFIVILIAAGMAALGLTLLTLTSMGPKMAGGLRTQEEAFNAAEAGFDAARAIIEDHFAVGDWADFSGRTLTAPTGIDIPFTAGSPTANYFRRLTDDQVMLLFDAGGDGTPDVAPLVAFRQTFAQDGAGATDARLVYTAFLINDEAGGGPTDPGDALLVVIGEVRQGTRTLASTRLEIGLSSQAQGT
jgi:hypothetical protein